MEEVLPVYKARTGDQHATVNSPAFRQHYAVLLSNMQEAAAAAPLAAAAPSAAAVAVPVAAPSQMNFLASSLRLAAGSGGGGLGSGGGATFRPHRFSGSGVFLYDCLALAHEHYSSHAARPRCWKHTREPPPLTQSHPTAKAGG
jgi:hypothetical protein